jgi:hypothetical protein
LGLTSPRPITLEHDVSQFICQHSELTEWLQKRALNNTRQMASQTRVACDKLRIVGYYALAAGSLAHATAARQLTKADR